MDQATIAGFIKAARRIHAQERLAAIADGAVAAGLLKRLDAQRHISRLEEEMGRPVDQRPLLPRLRAMGIKVDV